MKGSSNLHRYVIIMTSRLFGKCFERQGRLRSACAVWSAPSLVEWAVCGIITTLLEFLRVDSYRHCRTPYPACTWRKCLVGSTSIRHDFHATSHRRRFKRDDVNATSHQRRCNVMTLHRRWFDVALATCACWVLTYLLYIYCLSCSLNANIYFPKKVYKI